MANLSLATNFDEQLLKKVWGLNQNYRSTGNQVTEIYGSLPSNFGVNSARHMKYLPEISSQKASRHIRAASQLGLSFNYILNEVALSNLLYKETGKKKISRFIEKLIKMKVSLVTASNPLLIRFIRNRFPDLPVNVSIICEIDSLRKAKEWANLGVKRITIKGGHRNFRLIREFKKMFDCELELIANSSCQIESSLCYPHYFEISQLGNYSAHSFYLSNCKLAALKNPVDFFIKNGLWIRPEDLPKYDKAGADIYKILDRVHTTEELLSSARAYLSGSYKGNLLQLLFSPIAQYYYLDNSKLDGFIDRFVDNKCSNNCAQCSYCEKKAKHCLQPVKPKEIKQDIKCLEEIIEWIW